MVQLVKWSTVSKLNNGRYNHTSCSLDDKFVYIFGGFVLKEELFSVEDKNNPKKNKGDYTNEIEKLDCSNPNVNKEWIKIVISGETM